MAYGRQQGQRRYGYVRSGPQAQSPYYQTVQTQQTRDRYGPAQAATLARSEGLNQRYRLGSSRPSAPSAPAGPDRSSRQGRHRQAQQAASPYDYNTDRSCRSTGPSTRSCEGDARSQATRLRKEAAIDFGDAGYARGQLGDEATALAAEQNPFSRLRASRSAATRRATVT